MILFCALLIFRLPRKSSPFRAAKRRQGQEGPMQEGFMGRLGSHSGHSAHILWARTQSCGCPGKGKALCPREGKQGLLPSRIPLGTRVAQPGGAESLPGSFVSPRCAFLWGKIMNKNPRNVSFAGTKSLSALFSIAFLVCSIVPGITWSSINIC